LAIGLLLVGMSCGQSQELDPRGPIRLAQASTPSVPTPAVPTPSPTIPQPSTACLMNCDTRAGSCQGTCSVSNSVSSTFPTTVPGSFNPRPDSGTLAQCYLGCSTQQLSCKQACSIH
jgi:hypothetical protein